MKQGVRAAGPEKIALPQRVPRIRGQARVQHALDGHAGVGIDGERVFAEGLGAGRKEGEVGQTDPHHLLLSG